MEKNKVIFSTLIVLFIITLSSLISNSMAVLVFSLFIFTIGHIYTRTIESQNRDNAVYLFNIVLSSLTVFATLHYLDTVVDYEVFAVDWRDEYKFWIISNDLSQLNSISDIFNESFSYWRYGDLPGYAFYIGSIAYIGEHFLDGNNLLLQFLGSVLWGSFLSIVIYKIFLLFFDSKQAFKKVLYFSLLSVVFATSFVFLRDIIITFFYALIFYICLKKFSFSGLLKLIFIVFIVWQIRIEHGLFIIIFICYYIYKRYKHNKIILYLIVLSALIVIVFLFRDYFLHSFSTIERYGIRGEGMALEVDDSLGKILFKLPFPVKEIAIFITSQIRPFPPWSGFASSSTNFFAYIVNSLPMIYTLYWFIVVFSMFKWILVDKRFKLLPVDIKYLMMICVLFLFIVTQGSSGLRRIMCVYPFIYLVFSIIKAEKIKNKHFYKTRNHAVFIYLSLVVLYICFKFV